MAERPLVSVLMGVYKIEKLIVFPDNYGRAFSTRSYPTD